MAESRVGVAEARKNSQKALWRSRVEPVKLRGFFFQWAAGSPPRYPILGPDGLSHTCIGYKQSHNAAGGCILNFHQCPLLPWNQLAILIRRPRQRHYVPLTMRQLWHRLQCQPQRFSHYYQWLHHSPCVSQPEHWNIACNRFRQIGIG